MTAPQQNTERASRSTRQQAMTQTRPTPQISLDTHRRKLIDQFTRGKAASLLQDHSALIDRYFRESFEISAAGRHLLGNRTPWAMIAQGGYGRQEQCLHSDIDLLILFEKKVPKEAGDLIREMVYPLWDMGFDVGYAIRSISECIALARNDIEVLTPLLDARLVCGMSPLYSILLERVRSKLLSARQTEKLVHQLLQGVMARHHHFGDSSYLLEPNLKEGQGGLRDYHTLLWLSNIKYGIKSARDLEHQGLLAPDEHQALMKSVEFVWQVRNHLHHLTGRKCDQLHFEHQVTLPPAIGIRPHNGQSAVERFLCRLHENMETIKQLFMLYIFEQGHRRKFLPKTRKAAPPQVEGLSIDKDMLSFASAEAIVSNPVLLVRIFEESGRLKIPLSAAGRRLVREFSHLGGQSVLADRLAVRAFERCLTLTTYDFNVLDDMLSTGFLARCIPEFKDITHRIQYDEYHLYPVDRHSLRTVQTIKTFGTDEDISRDPLCGDFYNELKNRKLLLWAALLHDIGKGRPGSDHAGRGAGMTRDILQRFGYEPGQIDTVAFLVKEHLFLIKTATRRDINEEATALMCARRIKDENRLKMLYLLTVADSLSTGPKAWSSWTLALLRDLTLKTLNILRKGELASPKVLEGIEAKKAALIRLAPNRDLRRHTAALLSAMPPRYMLNVAPEDIRAHMTLFDSLKDERFVWQVETGNVATNRTVTVCAKDMPGLFSKMAGALTLSGFDILDARIFTWQNHTALDIFEVAAPVDRDREQGRWDKAARTLKAALSGEIDLGLEIHRRIDAYRPAKAQPKTRPHQVVVNNSDSDFLTILEVHTYDFPGLLFLITDALFRCRMDVWVAKIATKADQVVDVFYIRDVDGQKVDTTEQVDHLKTSILGVLEGAETPANDQ